MVNIKTIKRAKKVRVGILLHLIEKMVTTWEVLLTIQ